MKIEKTNTKLIEDLISLIEEGKGKLAYAANAAMTMT